MNIPASTSKNTVIAIVSSIFLRLFKDVDPLYKPIHVLEQAIVTDRFVGAAAQITLTVVDFAGKYEMAGKHGLLQLFQFCFFVIGNSS